MTNETNRTNENNNLIPPHGGYRDLKSFQTATLIYDLTVQFCKTYMTYKTNKSYRTYDQMVQAARSGRQNIAEGCQASGTSKKTELVHEVEPHKVSIDFFQSNLGQII